MINSLSLSASGLRLQQQRLEASAHNTANTTTRKDESASLRVRGQEGPGGGVVARVETGAETDVVQEAITQISSARQFQANVRAVQTQDEMLGALVDVKA